MDEASWQPWADLIHAGDAEGVVARLESLDEPARKRLSVRAAREAKKLMDGDLSRSWLGAETELRHTRADAIQALAWGTAGAVAAARSWWVPSDPALRARLVRCRPRVWRQDWADRAMDQSDRATVWEWPIVHALVREGLIERPDGVGYLIGAIAGFRSWNDDGGYMTPSRSLAASLRDEPDWLHDELWRLFEFEEVGMTSSDSRMWRGAQTWQEALCELTADGTVPRDRLLDESLRALRRDFTPHNARWYHKLHEALAPTPEEHVVRLDELLALLHSSDPAIVAFAVRALDKLQRAGRLPADRLFGAMAPALLVPVKGHATRAVKLAGRTLDRAPDAARLAVPVVADALAHESRDVQEHAVAILERHGEGLGDADRARLRDLAAEVDPALRARVLALGGAGAAPLQEDGIAAVAVPGRAPVVRDVPRLEGAPVLAPPVGVDELLDRLAVALERADDPDELELMLDGISRLRAAEVDPGRLRALVERVLALSEVRRRGVLFEHARDALAAAILGWLGGWEHDTLTLATTGDSAREALGLRVRELVEELPGGTPRALLATPTHAGGWIDPVEGVRRVAALGGRQPPVMDLAQLVLRLAPDRRTEARAGAEGVDGEAAAVLVSALGGDVQPPRRSKLGPAWGAAGHARDPGGVHFDFRRLAANDVLHFAWPGEEKVAVDPASPAALLVAKDVWWAWQPNGIERWLTTIWPANREGVFHLAARRLWVADTPSESGIGDILEVLLDPAEPMGEQAALAVSLALASPDLTERALAVDATIAALTTRRLDGATLGANLALLLRRHRDVVPSRWAATLADVAADGPLAAHDVQAAVERVLAAAAAHDRRALLGCVELLSRLAVDADAAVTDERARTWLSAAPAGTKLGRAAREALAVTGAGAARSRAAAAGLGAL